MSNNYRYYNNATSVAYKLFFALILLIVNVSAQNSSCADYSVTRTTGITYTSIITTGSTFSSWRNTSGAGSAGSFDDNRSNSTPIGFDFWYLGARYTSFCVSTNGFIDFSTSTAAGTGTGAYGYSNTVFSSSTNKTLLTLAPFYDDQVIGGDVNGSDSLNNYIRYQLNGTAPNRTLVVEWSQMTQYGSTAANLNYQVVLHETTGAIDFIYGTMTSGGLSWSYSAGMTGTNMSFTPTSAQLLTQQTANSTSFSNSSQNGLSTVPASNTQITFSCPAPTGNPSNLTFSGILQTGVTLNWNDNASNEVGYVIYYSIDNTNFYFNSQTAANATNSAITGLIPATTYYWQVYAVTDGYLSSYISGNCTTNPPTIVTSTVTGNWGTNSTWDCNCAPNANDNVIVANNTTVTLNTDGTANTLQVGQGSSGQLIMGNSTTNRTLAVSKDVTIMSGGSLISNTSKNGAHVLTVGGNLTNSGTLNLTSSKSNTNVTFNAYSYPGAYGNQIISGAGATTTFNNITVDNGGSSSFNVEATSSVFNAASGFLTLNNGTFKLSTGASITPFNSSITIPTTGGLWINNAGATVTTSGGDITLQGFIRTSNGTTTAGSASSNDILSQGGTLLVDGGVLNIAGSLTAADVTSTTYFTISSGTLTCATSGAPSYPSFDIEMPGSSFNMSGGYIIIQREGTGGGFFVDMSSAADHYNVTGGTLQIGNTSTPAGNTVQISSTIPVYNLTVNSSNVTGQITNHAFTVNNDLTITAGTFNPNAFAVSVKHNFTNNATFTTSGTLVFNGSSAQTISGSSTTTFSVLTINNTSGNVTLVKPANVSATLNLTSGLLNTDATNILTMQNGSVAPALTDASISYVNGPMNYQLQSTTKTTLNLPIGVATECRPAILTVKHTTAATLYNYKAQVFAANPWTTYSSTYPTDMPATVDTISGVHYWKIDRTDGAGTSQPSANLSGNQQIQLFFGTNDGVYQGANLTVVKTTSVNTMPWIDIGGTCALGNFTTPQSGNVTSTSSPSTFTSFSGFTLGSKTTGWNPLPIELLDFTAVPDVNKVDIKWETSTETNNAYFTIEKSKDGTNFTKMIDVPGAGNSTTQKDYFETDYQPYSGTSYYRLKQTDFNGNYKYFNIVPVTFNGSVSANILVYPNPVNLGEPVNMHISGYKGQEVVVVLIDSQGREFFTKVIMVEDDTQKITLYETQSLPAGTYIVMSSSNNKIYNSKIIVQ